MFIHFSGKFLGWHRYYTWAYEQALRTECGYTGTQPYWDWAQTAVTGLENSPLFDGSATSLSGNGAYIPGNELGNISIPTAPGSDLPPVYLPTARGVSVNLGPVLLPLPNGTVVSTGSGFAPNPRCLKRDLTSSINRAFANASSIATTILSNPTIASFQTALQGVPGSGNIGVHGGGHYALGGDPGRDFYVSPGDPAFYAHHAMIDRVWWIWQNVHSEIAFGVEGIAGTNTFLNVPPSENTTLETPLDLGWAWDGVLHVWWVV
ncbi:hypothetical protein E8E13_005848 [Curvularia kusanoi]|uniref:Tyrosinase copper-binding domain-containing protein n=1 Tax=Curvularia kusanoi TaxID=90978 RepID=A0A9P4W943_CURKU|nr:hypothetical protein E8E13_005848 [Curvularia kusanoi]